ncbi:MAG: phosphate ABC transporter ATP-binding protein PstB [Promethearchaeota archaeon]
MSIVKIRKIEDIYKETETETRDEYESIIGQSHLGETRYIIQSKELNLWYDEVQALKKISLNIIKNKVTALIGPSGCGKSTLIRCFNRMNDVYDNVRISGKIFYSGVNILGKKIQVTKLRKKIGIIFQKPNPFSMTIYDNVAYGPRIQKIQKRQLLDPIVKRSLKKAALWEEVKDRLDDSALALSGGQQQRLCIARALANEPDVLLMDEPTSSLDPIATAKIEALITELKEKYTVVIVTHNMQQATRISDFTGFMYLGELIEFDRTEKIFQNPSEDLTKRYIGGHFG